MTETALISIWRHKTPLDRVIIDREFVLNGDVDGVGALFVLFDGARGRFTGILLHTDQWQ